MTNLAIHQARHIAISAQFPKIEAVQSDKSRRLIEHLGYLQIDTITVIERAHHHILFSRDEHFQPEYLHRLQSRERSVFEYWAHAMSYLPMNDYRYSLPRMKRMENPQNRWAKSQLELCGKYMAPVLERIRNEGPLGAKDFKQPRHTKNKGWWNWKPAKMALELLFWRGELMVSERVNFNKRYDLTERVLPSGLDLRFPPEAEVARYILKRARRALGLFNQEELFRFLQPHAGRDSDLRAVGTPALRQVLADQLEEGTLLECTVDGLPGTYYVDPGTLDNLQPISDKEVRLLSPFDNLIIQRKRIKNLFDFEYALECYLPAAKRRYGYFVLPILWGADFVGRVDPKVDRNKKVLLLHNLRFQQDFKGGEQFILQFRRALKAFADFNKCTKVTLIKPGKMAGKPFPWRVINL